MNYWAGSNVVSMSDYDTTAPGGDSSADFEAALAGAVVLAQTYGRAKIMLDSKEHYYLTRVPQSGANGQYAQVRLPYSAKQVYWIEFVGMGGGSYTSWPNGWTGPTGVPHPEGTVIESTITSATFGTQWASMIGGPNATNGTFSNVAVAFTNITFRQPNNPQIACLDLKHMISAVLKNVTCGTTQFADGTSEGSYVVPTNAQGTAILMPAVNMNPPAILENTSVMGYYCGYSLGELTNGVGDVQAGWCVVGLSTTPAYHGVHLQRFIDVNNIYGLAKVDPNVSATAFMNIDSIGIEIEHWDMQRNNNQSPGFNRVYDLWANGLFLESDVGRIDAGVGIVSPLGWLQNGAATIRIADLNQKPGWLPTGPQVPAANIGAMIFDGSGNQIFRDCMLTVSGGSGVTVSIDGHSTGLSSGSFIVPVGKQFNLGAYTVAPTLMAVVL